MELEEWKESEAALLQAINLAPDFPGPYSALGIFNLEAIIKPLKIISEEDLRLKKLPVRTPYWD